MNNIQELRERYQQLCRVCMGNGSDLSSEMAALFKSTINTFSLSEMFTACTTLIPLPDDGLPDLICSACISNLVVAYDFQLQSIKSDTDLRQALNCLLTTVSDNGKQEKEEVEVKSTDIQIKDNNHEIKSERDNFPNDIIIVEKIKPKLELDDSGDGHNDVGGGDEDDDNSGGDEQQFFNDTTTTMDNDIDDPIGESIESDNDSVYKPQRKKIKTPRKKKEKKEIICPVCNKVFDKSYRLRRHINVHNPYGKPYECDICKHRFACESNLIRHKIKHTDLLSNGTMIIDKPRIFKCSECPREFAKQESLSSHFKTHKNTIQHREYVCEYCPRKFSKLNLMTRHMKIHDEAKMHKCNICDRVFALGGQLIDHMNRHKGVKPHICPYCNKGFQQSCTLKDHIRTHNGETPFLCSECGKSFNNGSNLRQHLLRHTGIKPFQCPECPSRFSCKGGLKSHLGTHTGAKPFICDICGSSFTKTYSLAKHKRIHTGERPYACEMCDMRFNSSDHVKRHMRTHTGEKPYKCTYCERAFAQSNDLVKHTRSHVGDNTYQCKQCPAAFRLHGELRAHGKVHFVQQKQHEQLSNNYNGKIEKSGSNSDNSKLNMSLITRVKQEAELKDENNSILIPFQQLPQQILKSDLSNDSIIPAQQQTAVVVQQHILIAPQQPLSNDNTSSTIKEAFIHASNNEIQSTQESHPIAISHIINLPTTVNENCLIERVIMTDDQ